MAEPLGLIGIVLICAGFANVLAPEKVWRRRRSVASQRLKHGVSDESGELTEVQRRVERVGGGVAAAAGVFMVVVAIVVG